MNLLQYSVKRSMLTVISLVGIILLTFIVFYIVPRNPLYLYTYGSMSDQDLQKMRAQWGFDLPPYLQFLQYVSNLLQGNLGKSVLTSRPVLNDLAERFPYTFDLAVFALIIAVAVGLLTGVVSAVKKYSIIDHLSRIFALFTTSMPLFWTGLIALYVFYFRLGWVSGAGILDSWATSSMPVRITGDLIVDCLLSGNLSVLFNYLRHLILPATILGFYDAAIIMRMTRSSMLTVLGQTYIRTARMKGLKERTVVLRHALKNALIPVVTTIGYVLGILLSGAVITENIFSWPGLGSYLSLAVLSVDLPAIMGSTVLVAVIYLLVNLFVDLIYGFIDPRVRVGR